MDINQIVSQLTPYAEKGWAVGEQVQIVNGVENVVVGVVCGVLAIIAVRLGTAISFRKLFSKNFSILNDGSETVALTGVAFGFFIMLLTTISIINLFDPWTWLSIFDPSLALAHHLLNKG